MTFVETGIRHPPEPAADDEVATVWRRRMASNFRCGLAAGFFAVVSLAALLPEIGISISFWPAAALRGFLADVEFRRHLTRPADGEHSSDERRDRGKLHRCVTELALLQRLDPSDLPDLGEQP